jgi:hypothetical protein
MRAKADEVRASFLHLEASWLRLAETADKKEAAPAPDNSLDSSSETPTVTSIPMRQS